MSNNIRNKIGTRTCKIYTINFTYLHSINKNVHTSFINKLSYMLIIDIYVGSKSIDT